MKGLKASEIKKGLDTTLGDSTPSYITIKRWVAEFKMKKLLKVREVAESVRISTDRIRSILHEHLTMRKL